MSIYKGYLLISSQIYLIPMPFRRALLEKLFKVNISKVINFAVVLSLPGEKCVVLSLLGERKWEYLKIRKIVYVYINFDKMIGSYLWNVTDSQIYHVAVKDGICLLKLGQQHHICTWNE